MKTQLEVPSPARFGYEPSPEYYSMLINCSTEWEVTLSDWHHPSWWDYKFVQLSLHGCTITSFFRNFPQIVHPMYARQNDNEFIITSRDYRCLSIYNITTDTWTDYIYPDENEYANGRAFCPKCIAPFVNDTLIIFGGVFDGPEECMVLPQVDLNNIMFDNVVWLDCYKGDNEE